MDQRIAPQPSFFGEQLVGTLRFPLVVGTQECKVGGRGLVDASLESTCSTPMILVDDAQEPIPRQERSFEVGQRRCRLVGGSVIDYYNLQELRAVLFEDALYGAQHHFGTVPRRDDYCQCRYLAG
jgi:hypothetical protein